MPHTTIYLWDDRLLFVAPAIDSPRTRRYAVTLLLAAGEQRFRLDAGRHGGGEFSAVLVAADVERSLHVAGGGYASLNLDPDSYDYHRLRRWLAGRGIAALEPRTFAAQRDAIREVLGGNVPTATAFQLTLDLVTAICGGDRPADLMLDLRVLHVARMLRAQMPTVPPVERLAEAVGLSPGRLKHLFKEQMNLSMKSYLLWARMRRARVLIQTGMPLTQVAAEVGFADQAHFSRRFQQFFGLTPSFLDRSTDVQVLHG